MFVGTFGRKCLEIIWFNHSFVSPCLSDDPNVLRVHQHFSGVVVGLRRVPRLAENGFYVGHLLVQTVRGHGDETSVVRVIPSLGELFELLRHVGFI